MYAVNTLVTINTEKCTDPNLLKHAGIVFRITSFVDHLAVLTDVRRHSCGGTTIIFGVHKADITPFKR